MGGKGNNLTVSSVNARVDKMAEQFQSSMDEFKKLLLDKQHSESASLCSGSSNHPNLLEKFLTFEKDIYDSLRNIKNDISELKEEQKSLNFHMNRVQMQQNQLCLLVHGVVEDNNENIYKIICDLINNNLSINSITMNQIVKCQRLGKNVKTNNNCEKSRPRPVVVKFCQQWARDLVFSNKKQFKNSGYFITEFLTTENMKILNACKSNFTATWTMGGYVHVIDNTGNRKKIKSFSDLPSLPVTSNGLKLNSKITIDDADDNKSK